MAVFVCQTGASQGFKKGVSGFADEGFGFGMLVKFC